MSIRGREACFSCPPQDTESEDGRVHDWVYVGTGDCGRAATGAHRAQTLHQSLIFMLHTRCTPNRLTATQSACQPRYPSPFRILGPLHGGDRRWRQVLPLAAMQHSDWLIEMAMRYVTYHAAEFGTKATPLCAADGAQTIEAFNWYLANEGTRMVREEAEQLLRERLRNPAFRKDMDTLLRPNFGRYDIDAAAELVRVRYFAHMW